MDMAAFADGALRIPVVDDLLEFVHTHHKSRESRSVSFYEGTLPFEYDGESLTVMRLHLRLLPPCGDDGSEVTRDLAPDGYELLDGCWNELVPLLLPSLSEVRSEGGAATLLSAMDWAKLRLEPHVMDRVHYSYTIVLRYFGWRLHDERSGEVDRSFRWRDRQRDVPPLRYARITRVLRFLIELKMHSYAVRLLLFVLEELRAERLTFLEKPLETCWLPMLVACEEIDPQDKRMLQRRLQKLHESDSE